MGTLAFIGVFVAIISTLIALAMHGVFDTVDPAPPMTQGWWGRGPEKDQPTDIKPWKVKVTDATLQDLKVYG